MSLQLLRSLNTGLSSLLVKVMFRYILSGISKHAELFHSKPEKTNVSLLPRLLLTFVIELALKALSLGEKITPEKHFIFIRIYFVTLVEINNRTNGTCHFIFSQH